MNILEGIPEQPLTLEQEWRCVVDKDYESLVMHSLREAFYYSKGCYQSRGLTDGEILSVCYEGLRKAAKRFRPNRIRFFGYAKADIRGTLSSNVKAHEVVKKVREYEIEQLPIEEEFSEEAAWKTDDEIPGYAGGAAYIPSDLPEFDAIYTREEWQNLAPVLRSVLNDKQRMVLELNFQGGLNLQQIANMLQFSRANIHHTKATALKKIRNRLIEQKKFFKEI